MALINCTECNKEISDKALTCPYCGNPIVSMQSPVQPKIIVKRNEGCFLQTLNMGCLLILIVIGLIVVSMLFSSVFFKDYSKKLEKQRIEKKK
ncbi:zinc-ribbon domain-containing protein [Chryseobacterium taklimakanense]|uniref:Zinc ribbon domain-containing protein n=1 Tax=Chryseobacterium taklimakanense TaxID=536441 RepID=A0A3G8WM18_9FLAO|nr:zinc-ribbon domain-containing protein [Chryseobacterium taklimakanense]AZI21523.1 zinc ribbon domain-containing protein [Chryseobacterium taklimakanense]